MKLIFVFLSAALCSGTGIKFNDEYMNKYRNMTEHDRVKILEEEYARTMQKMKEQREAILKREEDLFDKREPSFGEAGTGGSNKLDKEYHKV